MENTMSAMASNLSNTTDETIQSINSSKRMAFIFITVRVLISITILFINTCIISFYRQNNQNILAILPNRLLYSLSVCELQSGIAILINVACDILQTQNIIYRILADIYTTFLVKTVVMHLCGITLDRYLSLFYAFHYQAIITKRTMTTIIITAWCVPFLVSIIQFSWLYKVIQGSQNKEAMSFISDVELWFSIISYIIFFAIPMILLAFSFYTMIVEIRRLLYSTPVCHHMIVEELPKQKRVIYVFCSIYFTFLSLTLPYFTLRLLVDIDYWKADQTRINLFLIKYAILLKNLASAINPMLYATTIRGLKELANSISHKLPSKANKEVNIQNCARNSSLQTTILLNKDIPMNHL